MTVAGGHIAIAGAAGRAGAEWIWPRAAELAAVRCGRSSLAVMACAAPGRHGRAGRPAESLALTQARKLAVYLTYALSRVRPREVAEICGLRRQTVEHHIASIEARREDNAAFDLEMEQLELAVLAVGVPL